jgi:hypothetical protein
MNASSITFSIKSDDGTIILEKTLEISLKDSKFETLEVELLRIRKVAFEEITPAMLANQQSDFAQLKKKN